MISWQPRLRRQVVPGASRGVPSPTTSAASIIPYDYAATFVLTGRPGNVVQDVINISPEGGFVAVAIGYGLEEERGRSIQVRRWGGRGVARRYYVGQHPGRSVDRGVSGESALCAHHLSHGAGRRIFRSTRVRQASCAPQINNRVFLSG